MGRRWFGTAILAICALAATAPLLAHHSFAAEYDRNKPITITGTVTKVEWMNPHVYFYMDVKDPDGSMAKWAFEMANPASLYRRGWRKGDLKIGGAATVAGSLAKDGSKQVNASSVMIDGRKLFAGSSSGDDGYGAK